MLNEDKHRWLDGTLVESSYTNWYPDDPNNGNNDYVAIGILGDWIWADLLGSDRAPYICEAGLI